MPSWLQGDTLVAAGTNTPIQLGDQGFQVDAAGRMVTTGVVTGSIKGAVLETAPARLLLPLNSNMSDVQLSYMRAVYVSHFAALRGRRAIRAPRSHGLLVCRLRDTARVPHDMGERERASVHALESNQRTPRPRSSVQLKASDGSELVLRVTGRVRVGRAGAGRAGGCGRAGPAHTAPHRAAIHASPMSELRRSDRKRRQTDFLEGTETGRRQTKESALSARRARAAAIAAAYEPLVGLVQLGEVEGGEGSVWVGEPGEDGAVDSPAPDGFAPSPAERQQFLDLVQQRAPTTAAVAVLAALREVGRSSTMPELPEQGVPMRARAKTCGKFFCEPRWKRADRRLASPCWPCCADSAGAAQKRERRSHAAAAHAQRHAASHGCVVCGPSCVPRARVCLRKPRYARPMCLVPCVQEPR